MKVCRRLEESTAVCSWNLDGVDIWPVIKVTIWYRMAMQEANKDSGVRSSMNIMARIKQAVAKATAVTAHMLSSGATKTDVLFLGAKSHDVLYKSRQYNRFFEPLLEYSTEAIHTTYIQYGEGSISKGRLFTKQLSSSVLDTIWNIKEALFAKRQNEWRTLFFQLPDVSEVVSTLHKELGISEAMFLDYVTASRRVRDMVSVYKRVLAKAKPRLVMVLNYYGLHGMAMICAARMNGIKSIDLQHGPQLAGNAAYAPWVGLQNPGYNTLPDLFWCWDGASAHAINEWTIKTRHRAFVGGNPWVDYWTAKSKTGQIKNNSILFTMQPLAIADLLPLYLISFIREHAEIQWTFRYHPRQSQISISNIEKILDEHDLSARVTIEDTFVKPLPVSLMSHAINVTHFSGTAIEAALMGVPSIIIHPLGKEVFADLLSSGRASYADHGVAFEQAVFDLLDSSLKNEIKDENLNLSKITFQELLAS